MNKIKAAFVGFGEVNTPVDIIVRKCEKAKSLNLWFSGNGRKATWRKWKMVRTMRPIGRNGEARS